MNKHIILAGIIGLLIGILGTHLFHVATRPNLDERGPAAGQGMRRMGDGNMMPPDGMASTSEWGGPSGRASSTPPMRVR